MPLPRGFESQLFRTADELRAGSKLTPAEYQLPVLALRNDAAQQRLARTLRQERASATKRTAGFTTTPSDRKAFAALIAPIAKDKIRPCVEARADAWPKILRAVASFKLIGDGAEYNPVLLETTVVTPLVP